MSNTPAVPSVAKSRISRHLRPLATKPGEKVGLAVIVLDTHAWVWWVGGDPRLSEKAAAEIDTGMGTASLYVSSISAWEVAMLVRRGRLELTMPVDEWIARSQSLPFLRFVPVDNRIALRSVELADLPEDPADRIIAATAVSLGARLVTRDRRLQGSRAVETVW